MNLQEIILLLAVMLALAGVLWWPQRGVLARLKTIKINAERLKREDALKHIYKCQLAGRPATFESVAGAIDSRLNEVAGLVSRMRADDLLQISGEQLVLRPKGQESALHIIRAHRLWEKYLAEETGWDESTWHRQAEKMEHQLLPDDLDRLAARLSHPTHDPHGDPIPTRHGQMVDHGGRPLASLAPFERARIVHLEDEPEIVYAQLVADELSLGQEIHILESNEARLRVWAGGDEHILAPVVAANIFVVPLPTASESPSDYQRLGSLEPGQTAIVTALSPRCRGSERRRLLDLGLVPGTRVTAELRSPGHDPTAYRIRGALIALRRSQADMVQIEQVEHMALSEETS